MAEENPTGRRSFLKKTATATALAGGALGSVESAAAVTQEISVEITSDNGRAIYQIEVSDPNASAKDAENSDSVTNYSDYSLIEGELDADSGDLTDTYEMSGHITWMKLDGHIDVQVTNPYAWNGDRTMHIRGGPGDYVVQINGTDIQPKDRLESGDSTDSNSANGSLTDGDDDYYLTKSATIEWVSVQCTGSTCEPIYIDHPL